MSAISPKLETHDRSNTGPTPPHSPAGTTRLLAPPQTDAQLLRTALRNSANDFKILRGIELRLREQCSNQNLQIEELKQTVSSQKEKITILQEMEALLRKRIQRQESEDIESSKLQAMIEELKIQREELHEYAALLFRERSKIQTLCQDIADEFDAAHQAHPLQDYLIVTEHELARIELQLARTPALATERPRLEKSLTELTQQSEFLKQLLEGSKARFAEHVGTLKKIIASEALQALPPPPPATRPPSTV